MKTLTLVVFGGFVLIGIFTNVECKKNKNRGNKQVSDGNSTSDTSLECLGKEIPVPKLMFGLDECTTELSNPPEGSPTTRRGSSARAKKKFAKRNQMCIKRCQRQKQGILDLEGKLDNSGSIRFIEDIFPQKARPRIQRGLNRCAEDHGDAFTNIDNCKEYKKFEKCMMRIITKSCGWKNDKGTERSNKQGGKRRGNKGKNKENNRRQPTEDIDEDSDGEE